MELIIIFCSIFLIFGDLTRALNPCRPESGRCIALQQCKQLYRLISTDLTPKHRQELLDAQCSTRRNPVEVCCPKPASPSDFPSPGQCGTQIKERIVGGEDASIMDYPWMALLKYTRPNGNGDYFCGGALIHKNYVVTAAHCISSSFLRKNRYSITSIRLGEHDLSSERDCEEGDCADPVVDVNVEDIIIHEDYLPESNQQYNDIALIRLARPVRFTDYIRPICLPFSSELKNKNFDNDALVVAGFGKTENASRSNVKKKLEVNGFNLARCNDVYSLAGRSLINKQICAGGLEGKDSCSGDSGGPLMGEHSVNRKNPYSYLVGVVSFGPRICGTPGFPGVYTRIDQYLEWILSNIKV